MRVMRSLLAFTVLALAVLAPASPQGDDAIPLELEVGEGKEIVGFRPLCDDPSIAWFSDDGKGVLRGLKAGTTICSVSRGSPLGPRRVYRVVVVPSTKKDGEGGDRPKSSAGER